MSWRTPRLSASARCSCVWPAREKPASNSPAAALTTSTAASACAAPEIMFGRKSRCPGASSSVTRCRAVSTCATATSVVTPRARSSACSSSTHAYANEPFPAAALSACSRRSRCAPTTPSSASRCPSVVLFPASTCPITTTLSSPFPPASPAASRACAAATSSACRAALCCCCCCCALDDISDLSSRTHVCEHTIWAGGW